MNYYVYQSHPCRQLSGSELRKRLMYKELEQLEEKLRPSQLPGFGFGEDFNEINPNLSIAVGSLWFTVITQWVDGEWSTPGNPGVVKRISAAQLLPRHPRERGVPKNSLGSAVDIYDTPLAYTELGDYLHDRLYFAPGMLQLCLQSDAWLRDLDMVQPRLSVDTEYAAVSVGVDTFRASHPVFIRRNWYRHVGVEEIECEHEIVISPAQLLARVTPETLRSERRPGRKRRRGPQSGGRSHQP